jgi:hypothetical protein
MEVKRIFICWSCPSTLATRWAKLSTRPLMRATSNPKRSMRGSSVTTRLYQDYQPKKRIRNPPWNLPSSKSRRQG